MLFCQNGAIINFTNAKRRVRHSYRFFFLTLRHPLFDCIPIVEYRPACTAEYNEGKRNFRRVNYERARKIAISRMLRRLLLRPPPPLILLSIIPRSVRFVFLFSDAYTNTLASRLTIMIDSTVIQSFSPRHLRLISVRQSFTVCYYYFLC